jgi:hypothetical protein
MLYLAAGFTFGALMLANKAIPFTPWLWRLRPIHIEILLLGWIAQFAMGVAFWMLPRFHSSRGDVRPAWAAFFLLNTGLLLAGLGAMSGLPAWLALTGRLLEIAAVAAYAFHAWPRVKPFGL